MHLSRHTLPITAVLLLSGPSLLGQAPGKLGIGSGSITFISSAPHEHITATNTAVSGVLSLDERSFAVRVPMRSFVGFNSPLQKEHFEENYLEAVLHPNALFEGRIIEAIDLRTPGQKQVRAKGRFTIHGVARERIVLCDIIIERTPTGRNTVHVRAELTVPLADHDIRVPRIVQQKIASVIDVKVDLLFQPVERP